MKQGGSRQNIQDIYENKISTECIFFVSPRPLLQYFVTEALVAIFCHWGGRRRIILGQGVRSSVHGVKQQTFVQTLIPTIQKFHRVVTNSTTPTYPQRIGLLLLFTYAQEIESWRFSMKIFSRVTIQTKQETNQNLREILWRLCES